LIVRFDILGVNSNRWVCRRSLSDGVAIEVTGRGIAELAAWRDRFLVDLLALRAGQK